MAEVYRSYCKGKNCSHKSQAGTEGRWRAFSVNNLGARMEWVVSAFPQLPYPWEKKPGTNYTGGWVDLTAAVGESRKSP